MDEKEKADFIEADWKSSDDPAEYPLSKAERERIVFVEREKIIEKPVIVERTVYKDAPPEVQVEHHHHYRSRWDRPSAMSGAKKFETWMLIPLGAGIILLLMLLLPFLIH